MLIPDTVTNGERGIHRLSSKHYRAPYGAFSAAAGKGPTISLTPNIGPRLHRYKQWVSIVDEVIKWPHPEQLKVEKSLYNPKTISKWEIPSLRDKSFEMHLRTFKEKLAFWELVLEGKDSFMPPIEVARRSVFLGPEFPKYIKDCIEDSLRDKSGFDRDLLYEDSFENAWGHDYFFSPRDCLNYQLPDDLSDIKRVLIDPPDIPEKSLKRLEAAFRDFIKVPQHKVELDDVDYLEMFSGSSSFVGEDKPRRRVQKYEANIGRTLRLDKQFKFDYCFVQKNAAEGRAALCASPGTLLQIKRFHKMFKAVADCPEDMYSNPTVTLGLEKWLTSDNPRVGYIMSDIKKSGLTFNRNLHNLLIKVLHELMPTWGWDDFLDFGNATICIPGISSKPLPLTNGYGLGVMDCVISFTQACIYNIMIEDHDLVSYHLEAKFWSDDSVIKAKLKVGEELDLPQLYELMEEFNELSSQMGIHVHDKKPYISKMGVFLESYGRPRRTSWDASKRCQYIGCLFDVLKCPDIFRAKEVFSTLMLDVPEELMPWVTYAQEIIVSFWGYEFSPEEIWMPFEAGGWSYVLEDGWNIYFQRIQDITDTEISQQLSRLANCHSPRRRRLALHKKNELYISSLINMGWEDDPSAHNWKIMASSVLLSDYKARRDVHAIETKVLKARQDAWVNACKPKHSTTEYGAMLEFWDSVKRLGWYLPPQSMVTSSEIDYGAICHEELNNQLPARIDRSRAWLYLSEQRGSTVKVVDPWFAYTDYESVCSAMLRSISGAKHTRLSDCVFSIVNNYNLEELSKKLFKMYGPCYIKDSLTENHWALDLIKDSMKSTSGDFVFPLAGSPYSFLTKLEEYSPLLNRPYVNATGAALLLGNKDLNYSCWEFPPEAFSFAEELSSKKDTNKVVHTEPFIHDPNQTNWSEEDIRIRNEYYRSMILGAMHGQHLDMLGERAGESFGTLFTEEVPSAFDDEDFELGEMFG
jgi:hypothetical protein